MSLLCKIGRHVAGPRVVANAGIHVGWCSACQCELVLGARGWSAVPRGFRLVWKGRRTAPEAACEQLELMLAMPDPRALKRAKKSSMAVRRPSRERAGSRSAFGRRAAAG